MPQRTPPCFSMRSVRRRLLHTIRLNAQALTGLALSIVITQEAAAQICLGRPSLNVHRANATVRVDRREGATGFGAGLAAGSDRAFGTLAASRLRYAELNAAATSMSASAGWSVPPAIPTLFICPLVQASYGRGPDEDSTTYTVRRTALTASAGLAIAGQIAVTSAISLIPNVTAGILLQRSTRTSGDRSASGSDLGGTVSAGLSLLLSEIVAIQPAVRLPVGFTDRDPVYSLGVSVGLLRAQPR